MVAQARWCSMRLISNLYGLFVCLFFVALRPMSTAMVIAGRSVHLTTLFTCVALARAGLVVGPLRPSGRPSVRLSVCPSVRPSVCPSVRNTLGCQVCVICNSKTFHSFLFKLCLMIVHILKMCTSYFVHVS